MENTNRDRQHEDSMRFVSISILGIIILMIIMTLLGGCGTTKPTKKCCDKEKVCHVITEWDGDREIRWHSSEAAEHAAKYCGGDLEKGNKK